MVDAEGAAAPGVEVVLEARGADPFSSAYVPVKQRTLTDVDGRFRFDDAGARWNRLTFRARGYAFEVRGAVKPGVIPQPVKLSPGHSLSVVVSDANGPAADVLVRFEGDDRSPWVATGEAGRARLEDLPAGSGRIVVEAGDRGVGETSRVSLPLTDVRVFEIGLAPGRIVEGLVFDIETRQPIVGAVVSLRNGEGERPAETDRDGRYRYAALPPSSYDVEVRADGYAERAEEADTRQTDHVEVDLALARSSGLSGRVVNEAGRPVAEATGRVRPSENRTGIDFFRFRRAFRTRGPDFTTGADGAFSASGLAPGGDQRLIVSHPEYGSTTVGGLSLRAGEETKDVTVVLQRGPSLVGHVTDLEDDPIVGVVLTLERSYQGRRRAYRRFVGAPGADAPKAQTDSAGAFRFGGVTPGNYALVARAPGYAVTHLDPVPLGDAEGPLVLRMPPGAAISGRVVRPDGSGAKGVFVMASDGR